MNKIKREIFDWVKVVLIAFVLYLIINNYIIITAEVPTGSMENTIHVDDRIIAFRLSYLLHSPNRGDIVVFPCPDDESMNYLKRIIGLPGDTIEIIDGNVYVNGDSEPLNESYLKETPIGSYGPYQVPENSYFVMGDNRNESEDSRYWTNTYVMRDKIIGKVFLRYYPSVKTLK